MPRSRGRNSQNLFGGGLRTASFALPARLLASAALGFGCGWPVEIFHAASVPAQETAASEPVTPDYSPNAEPAVPEARPETADLPEAEPKPDSLAVPAPPIIPGIPPADPQLVRFTAWNVKNFLHVAAPPPEGSSEKSKPAKEIAAVVALLSAVRPDILGVCEMGSTADLAILKANLKTAGLDLPNSEWVDGADTTRHLALLSRFPIIARQPVTNQRYLLDDSQFPVQRGFLDVTVQVHTDYQLRLVGVHLKSRFDTPEADQELMRRNEAQLLREHIDTVLTAAPETNLLVYGDFNDSRDQPSFKAIKGIRGAAAALSEIPAVDDSGERWTFYYPTADEYSRIDFLMASPALMPEVKPGAAFLPGGNAWSRASDHRPISVTLTPDDQKTPRKRSRSKLRAGD